LCIGLWNVYSAHWSDRFKDSYVERWYTPARIEEEYQKKVKEADKEGLPPPPPPKSDGFSFTSVYSRLSSSSNKLPDTPEVDGGKKNATDDTIPPPPPPFSSELELVIVEEGTMPKEKKEGKKEDKKDKEKKDDNDVAGLLKKLLDFHKKKDEDDKKKNKKKKEDEKRMNSGQFFYDFSIALFFVSVYVICVSCIFAA